MAIKSNNDPELTTAAVVTIRIPNRADSDLATDARERLSRGESVDAVVIDELCGIDPNLSATTITVAITLHWTTTSTDTEVSGRLAEVPGLETIERIE